MQEVINFWKTRFLFSLFYTFNSQKKQIKALQVKYQMYVFTHDIYKVAYISLNFYDVEDTLRKLTVISARLFTARRNTDFNFRFHSFLFIYLIVSQSWQRNSSRKFSVFYTVRQLFKNSFYSWSAKSCDEFNHCFKQFALLNHVR